MGEDHITPRGDYQECVAHALVMAHILENAVMFMPQDSELWHRSSVELSQFSGWINARIDDGSRFAARQNIWRARAQMKVVKE